jgi:hypothetical protein
MTKWVFYFLYLLAGITARRRVQGHSDRGDRRVMSAGAQKGPGTGWCGAHAGWGLGSRLAMGRYGRRPTIHRVLVPSTAQQVAAA